MLPNGLFRLVRDSNVVQVGINTHFTPPMAAGEKHPSSRHKGAAAAVAERVSIGHRHAESTQERTHTHTHTHTLTLTHTGLGSSHIGPISDGQSQSGIQALMVGVPSFSNGQYCMLTC